MTFVEWLHGQASLEDRDTLPYAGLFVHGPWFAQALGEHPPDPAAFSAYLSALCDPLPSAAEREDLLKQLVIAEATWRTDDMVVNPPTADGSDEPPDTSGMTVEARPLPRIKCGFRDLDGTRCPAYAVEGSVRCTDHGGGITDPAVRGSLLLLAYAQMVYGSKTAVSTLIDVMEHSKNDLARVNAAKEMLDRAGLGVDAGHVQVTAASDGATDTREAQLDRIKSHLDSVRERMLPPAPPSDDEIVDAEIVDEVA